MVSSPARNRWIVEIFDCIECSTPFVRMYRVYDNNAWKTSDYCPACRKQRAKEALACRKKRLRERKIRGEPGVDFLRVYRFRTAR